MSSGSLPGNKYHRASQLGAGSFGSVVVVYNDDGEEYALKLFLPDDEDDDDDDEEGSYRAPRPLDIGALREISALRLLRDDNRHGNITELVDIQAGWGVDEDEDDSDAGGGAGTGGCLSAALPLYKSGSLQDALDKGIFRSYPRRVKVAIAHGLLSAVAYLHDNQIIHRDIKPNNIMLQEDDEHEWRPILIDFSLAKLMLRDQDESEPTENTGEVGTANYVAPEVVARDPYGLPCDLWSVGVVLLELLTDETFPAAKDRHVFAMIKATLERLENQPFPNLLRGLLQTGPRQRLTARQALEHPLFLQKFHFPVPPLRLIDIGGALPLEIPTDDGDDAENKSPNAVKKKNRLLEARRKRIDKVCAGLGVTHPMTRAAAFEYSRVLEQLDDTLDEADSLGLLHCVVLAHRFFELEVLDLTELDEAEKGPFGEWSLEEYVDEESTLFMMLDYCLYPRGSLE